MANNLHKRIYMEDKFGRRYYCDNARLRQLRSDKKQSEKVIRRRYNRLMYQYVDASENPKKEAPIQMGRLIRVTQAGGNHHEIVVFDSEHV